MISITIPTFNNVKYLKLCIESLEKNSHFKNEILLHINDGSDGTLEFAKQKKLKFTQSSTNEGLCVGMNKASKLSSFNYILYAHDDMYFLPKWDLFLMEEAKILKTNKFYLSSIMINGDPKLNGHLNLNAGDTIDNFNEKYLLENYKNLKHDDFQGSTWAPHLFHKDIWNEVGGFSEEFSPGLGSDPDFNMKLWKSGIRIFKCINKSRVYHFGSITIHKKKSSLKKNHGSIANKISLLKWGITIKFFKRYYLKSHILHNENLKGPNKDIFYYIDLIKNKFSYFYYKIFSSIRL